MNDLRIAICYAKGEKNEELIHLIETSGYCTTSIKVEYDNDDFLEAIKLFEPDVIMMSNSFITSSFIDSYDGLNIRFPIIFFGKDEVSAIDIMGYNCIDSLIDPITIDKLERAFQKFKSMMFTFQNISDEYLSTIKQIIQRKNQSIKQDKLRAIITEDLNNGKYQQRFVIRSGDSLKIINVSDIWWVKSSGNYVKIKCGSEILLARVTLKSILASMNPNYFFRVHKSSIINIRYVDFFKDLGQGDFSVVFRNGDELRLSRNYNSFLKEL